VNLDWHRLRAVVLESDDWGLCAWVPDDQAHRSLTGTPAFRSLPGRIYGRSTLERAEDVRAIGSLLFEFRGGDGFPPVWQANTVVANPDFDRMRPPQFEGEDIPVIAIPELPSRWVRPGLDQAVTLGIDEGWWWPELHGLHHVPVAAWLGALRRGAHDARRAHEQQVMVCEAVETTGEYDPSESLEVRKSDLERAAGFFRKRFGRAASSLCPPDYRWDDALDETAASLGITTFQGMAERAGGRLHPRIARFLGGISWPQSHGPRFHMPPRIAFEPRGNDSPEGPVGARAAHEAARSAWRAGRPAIVSSHRVNYAHLDPAWREQSLIALRDLIARLAQDGATFLTDAEARALTERGWSARPIGCRGVLVRFMGVPKEPVTWPLPDVLRGTIGAEVIEGRGAERATVRIEDDQLIGSFDPGEYLVTWRRG
jgi:hypothetical protein